MKVAFLFPALLLLGGCHALPRDPDGTSTQIMRSGILRVGLIDDPHPFDRGQTAALIARLAQETGAKPQTARGAAEPLLADLDAGRLDLVIGPFAADSPWKTMVALAPPLAASGTDDAPLQWQAAARNGENRWIMTVEQASRAIAPEGDAP
ncbi:MAG: hypothetical protein QHC40_11065 [Sphingobium sp.]|nr:hypothetical protein [Sphingobium sp.]